MNGTAAAKAAPNASRAGHHGCGRALSAARSTGAPPRARARSEPVDGHDRDEAGDPVADEQQHVLEAGGGVGGVHPQHQREAEHGGERRGQRTGDADTGGLEGQ